MAVGDVVNAVGVANGALTFQPAAGVEVMITATFSRPGQTGPSLTNGTTTSTYLRTNQQAAEGVIEVSRYITINNSVYLTIGASGIGEVDAYCGIQIN